MTTTREVASSCRDIFELSVNCVRDGTSFSGISGDIFSHSLNCVREGTSSADFKKTNISMIRSTSTHAAITASLFAFTGHDYHD